VLTRAH
jgi:hypothetical protein